MTIPEAVACMNDCYHLVGDTNKVAESFCKIVEDATPLATGWNWEQAHHNWAVSILTKRITRSLGQWRQFKHCIESH